MSKKHHGHSHHKHDGFSHDHHHHGGHDVLFGTRGDDVLNGTEKSEAIIGFKGNDELFGNGGNDWLDGGKGNDLLDGGAGSDHVFGGKGNDVAVYSLAANAGTDACGKATHDYYDGGKGHDVLQLILTPEELASEAVKADIAAFEAFLADHGGGCGSHGAVFEFTSFDLTVRNFEALEVISGNTPPVANGDSYSTLEDTPLAVPAAGVLANDTDADGDSLTAPVNLVVNPTHGALAFNEDGSFTYTPDKDYFGPDSFSYRASDGQDESASTAVNITVVSVNDLPVANTDYATVPENSASFEIDVLANDTPGPDNESGQSLAILDFGPRPTDAGGEWAVSADNTILYTPPENYVGNDSFRYLAVDDDPVQPWSSSGLVEIDVV